MAGCSGVDVVQVLPMAKMDDVFVTGVLRERLAMELTQLDRSTLLHCPTPDIPQGALEQPLGPWPLPLSLPQWHQECIL
jgi:hypothetical protein